MSNSYLLIKQSAPLAGRVELCGSKNATLAIMASLILTKGVSKLYNVPASADVVHMIRLLQDLGAHVEFDVQNRSLLIDTSTIHKTEVAAETMGKMRASMVVMGPLLARFSHAQVALPGGCVIGARPIGLHLKGFREMGAVLERDGSFLRATLSKKMAGDFKRRVVLDYPSVGATENIMMFATLCPGETFIVNAAHEPEVFDLITVLRKMGAEVETMPGSEIRVKGVECLQPIEHNIIPDRLEAGAFLLAAAMTKGDILVTNAQPRYMDVFLEKLREMGHEVVSGENGIRLRASSSPQAVSFKTGPYPGFPTDLQAPMMAAQCLAEGVSVIEETVFENRLMHVKELQKMGAQIGVEGDRAIIRGVDELYGTDVIATDIRASCALVLAGLVANDETRMTGIRHWKRGYDRLEDRLRLLGGDVQLIQPPTT